MKHTISNHVGCGIGLVLLSVMLGACTAHWQAPLESRGHTLRRTVAIPGSANAYRVRRGDTLVSIAWRANLDWRQLARWNRLRPPYTIIPGQMLDLRPPPSRPTVPATKGPSPHHIVSSNPKPRSPVTPARSVPQPHGTIRPTPKTQNRQKLSWQWPTDGTIKVRFAESDPTRKGIKITGSLGQPIRAAEGGSVVYSGSGLIGYGQLIIIKHNDKYLSAYGNNRKLLVKEGDQVTKGEKIAEMGRIDGGRPVLHFEIRREGEPVNPLSLLPKIRR